MQRICGVGAVNGLCRPTGDRGAILTVEAGCFLKMWAIPAGSEKVYTEGLVWAAYG